MNKYAIAGTMAVLAILAGMMGYFSHRIFPGVAQEIYRVVSAVGFFCAAGCIVYAVRFNTKSGK